MRARCCATRCRFLRGAGHVLLGSLFAIVALLLGCGGGSTSTAVSAVALSPVTSFVAVNAQQTFTATAQDSKGRTISGITFTWTSSAPDVASVDTSGIATGHTVGAAQITATASGVTSAAATLNVVNSTATAASVSLAPISATIQVGQTQAFTATAKDVNGNTLSGVTFTWHNTSAGVAIVSTSGLATGTAPGMTVITASVGVVASPAATLTVTAP